MSHTAFVLVADRDPEIREMVSRVLRGIACVIEVPDAEGARHASGQWLFDLVIAEGLGLLHHFKEAAPATRRILITGARLDAARLVRDGQVDAVVAKPWNVLRLRHVVQQLLDAGSRPAWGRAA